MVRPFAFVLAAGFSLAAFSLVADGFAAAEGAAVAEPIHVDLPLTEKKLANGLDVIVHEDHRTKTVSVHLRYDVGGKDDPPGRSGFAHLFEHIMLQGSRHVPEDAFFRYLEQAGASDRNATTFLDGTTYFETLPSNELELALWLESDRMAFLLDHVDAKTFANQREVVKNERRQSYEDKPYGFAWRYIYEAIHPEGHPYRRLTIGDPRDLDAATLDDARAFFRTFYVPSNASLVIAGDVSTPAAMALAEKYFGPIVDRPVPPRAAPPPVVLGGETRLDVAAGVKLAKVYVAWPTPAIYRDGDADLDVLATLLVRGESSRLRRAIVRDLRVATDVEAYQESGVLGSVFVIEATVRPGRSADEVLRAIDAELAKVRVAGAGAIQGDEAARARRVRVAGIVFDVEEGRRRADRINEYTRLAGDPRYITKDFARYEATTAASLGAAAARHLPPDRRVVEVVTPVQGASIAGDLRRTTTSAGPSAPGGAKVKS